MIRPKINFVVRLQHWMDSVPGQTFLNYAYSWGASIVILGALFKLTHLPGGNLMLFIGMGTEVVVFFISAFDRPFDKTSIGKELPADYQTDEEIAAAIMKEQGLTPEGEPLASGDAEVPATPAVAASPAAGVVMPQPPAIPAVAQEATIQPVTEAAPAEPAPSVEAVSQPATADVAQPVSPREAAVPEEQGEGAVAGAGTMLSSAPSAIVIPRDANVEQLQAIISQANNELLKRAQAVLSPEMEAVTKTYIERMQTLSDTLSKVDQQSARLSTDNEELERLSRTLTSINSIYELQLKGASAQIVTIDQINEQTHQLVKQIEELNGVYARMIKALTINANATPSVGA